MASSSLPVSSDVFTEDRFLSLKGSKLFCLLSQRIQAILTENKYFFSFLVKLDNDDYAQDMEELEQAFRDEDVGVANVEESEKIGGSIQTADSIYLQDIDPTASEDVLNDLESLRERYKRKLESARQKITVLENRIDAARKTLEKKGRELVSTMQSDATKYAGMNTFLLASLTLVDSEEFRSTPILAINEWLYRTYLSKESPLEFSNYVANLPLFDGNKPNDGRRHLPYRFGVFGGKRYSLPDNFHDFVGRRFLVYSSRKFAEREDIDLNNALIGEIRNIYVGDALVPQRFPINFIASFLGTKWLYLKENTLAQSLYDGLLKTVREYFSFDYEKYENLYNVLVSSLIDSEVIYLYPEGFISSISQNELPQALDALRTIQTENDREKLANIYLSYIGRDGESLVQKFLEEVRDLLALHDRPFELKGGNNELLSWKRRLNKTNVVETNPAAFAAERENLFSRVINVLIGTLDGVPQDVVVVESCVMKVKGIFTLLTLPSGFIEFLAKRHGLHIANVTQDLGERGEFPLSLLIDFKLEPLKTLFDPFAFVLTDVNHRPSNVQACYAILIYFLLVELHTQSLRHGKYSSISRTLENVFDSQRNVIELDLGYVKGLIRELHDLTSTDVIFGASNDSSVHCTTFDTMMRMNSVSSMFFLASNGEDEHLFDSSAKTLDEYTDLTFGIPFVGTFNKNSIDTVIDYGTLDLVARESVAFRVHRLFDIAFSVVKDKKGRRSVFSAMTYIYMRFLDRYQGFDIDNESGRLLETWFTLNESMRKGRYSEYPMWSRCDVYKILKSCEGSEKNVDEEDYISKIFGYDGVHVIGHQLEVYGKRRGVGKDFWKTILLPREAFHKRDDGTASWSFMKVCLYEMHPITLETLIVYKFLNQTDTDSGGSFPRFVENTVVFSKTGNVDDYRSILANDLQASPVIYINNVRLGLLNYFGVSDPSRDGNRYTRFSGLGEEASNAITLAFNSRFFDVELKTMPMNQVALFYDSLLVEAKGVYEDKPLEFNLSSFGEFNELMTFFETTDVSVSTILSVTAMLLRFSTVSSVGNVTLEMFYRGSSLEGVRDDNAKIIRTFRDFPLEVIPNNNREAFIPVYAKVLYALANKSPSHESVRAIAAVRRKLEKDTQNELLQATVMGVKIDNLLTGYPGGGVILEITSEYMRASSKVLEGFEKYHDSLDVSMRTRSTTYNRVFQESLKFTMNGSNIEQFRYFMQIFNTTFNAPTNEVTLTEKRYKEIIPKDLGVFNDYVRALPTVFNGSVRLVYVALRDLFDFFSAMKTQRVLATQHVLRWLRACTDSVNSAEPVLMWIENMRVVRTQKYIFDYLHGKLDFDVLSQWTPPEGIWVLQHLETQDIRNRTRDLVADTKTLFDKKDINVCVQSIVCDLKLYPYDKSEVILECAGCSLLERTQWYNEVIKPFLDLETYQGMLDHVEAGARDIYETHIPIKDGDSIDRRCVALTEFYREFLRLLTNPLYISDIVLNITTISAVDDALNAEDQRIRTGEKGAITINVRALYDKEVRDKIVAHLDDYWNTKLFTDGKVNGIPVQYLIEGNTLYKFGVYKHLTFAIMNAIRAFNVNDELPLPRKNTERVSLSVRDGNSGLRHYDEDDESLTTAASSSSSS